MSTPISVAIVDDHPLFRQGLRQLLEKDGRFIVSGEAEDGQAAIELLRQARPQVAILDINMPRISGLVVANQVQACALPTKLVILTMNKDEETFNRAMDYGVLGYILKENAVQDILSGVLAAARGEHYISPTISQYLVHRRTRSLALSASKPGLELLTKAERRIVRMIADKKTSRQIAGELFISQRTVEAHRSNICSKLGLRGSHSLLQFALENRSSLD